MMAGFASRIMRGQFLFFLTSALMLVHQPARADEPPTAVGVAKVDITPDYPVRLSGFGFRRTESEGVTHTIWAKALAFDDKEPALLITVDNLGIPAYMLAEVGRRLDKRVGLKPE